MHEFSLCQGLVSILAKQPFKQGDRLLTRIEVTVGPLSGVEPELLMHAYPLVVKNTPFENVELSLTNSDVVVECQSCLALSHAKINDLRCTSCGCDKTLVRQGNECALTNLYYREEAYV